MPTIKDVANRAKVSIKTVSRVINDSPMVSPTTRERVLKVMEEMDYHPNALARGLVTKETRIIGLVVADVTNPYFPELIRGVEDVANANEYNVFLCNTDEDPEKELVYIKLLREKQVDGIILSGSRTSPEQIRPTLSSGLPVIFINRKASGKRVGLIMLDNFGTAYAAVKYLLGLGHENIGYLGGSILGQSNTERKNGFIKAMVDNKGFCDHTLIIEGFPGKEGGYRAMTFLLERDRPLSAIFAYDDMIAVGAIEACKERGLHVPRDISIVGFDDIDLAAHINPRLTTFDVPKYEMGRAAAKMLFDMLGGKEYEEEMLFIPKLMVRDSCCRN